MPSERAARIDPDQPMVYHIRVRGHLGPHWSDWFEGLAITLEDNGETLLSGPVVDQAALHGLLRKVRDLGMPLVSVVCVRPGQTEASGVNETPRARSQEVTHESDRVPSLRITGRSSAQRGGETGSQRR